MCLKFFFQNLTMFKIDKDIMHLIKQQNKVNLSKSFLLFCVVGRTMFTNFDNTFIISFWRVKEWLFKVKIKL